MLIETWVKDDRVLEIHRDEHPQNVREEYDHCGVMACWHDRRNLGDEQPKERPEEYRGQLEGDPVILPLFLMDHSVITMRTQPFSCAWDSGQVGFIYMPEEVRKREEFTREEAKECLLAEVAEYDNYLTGSVYGFEIYTRSSCSECGASDRKDEDSCWGFNGRDHLASGLLDHAGIESLDDWEKA